jgi:hypothetical protein
MFITVLRTPNKGINQTTLSEILGLNMTDKTAQVIPYFHK